MACVIDEVAKHCAKLHEAAGDDAGADEARVLQARASP
jgi:hypothetical protein